MSLPFDIAQIRTEVESESTRIFQLTERDLATVTTANRADFQELLPLVDFVIERMEAAFYLMKAGMNWDSDIIWRSVLEVFSKFIKITNQPDMAKVGIAIHEFWNDLADIETMKDSNWAKKVIATNLVEDTTIFESVVLSDEKENELKAKPSWANRPHRKHLSERWSFNNIFEALHKDGYLQPFQPPITQLQHSYMIYSHTAHGDAYGLRLIDFAKNYKGVTEELSLLVDYIGLLMSATGVLMYMTMTLLWLSSDIDKYREITERYYDYKDFILSRADLVNKELFSRIEIMGQA